MYFKVIKPIKCEENEIQRAMKRVNDNHFMPMETLDIDCILLETKVKT